MRRRKKEKGVHVTPNYSSPVHGTSPPRLVCRKVQGGRPDEQGKRDNFSVSRKYLSSGGVTICFGRGQTDTGKRGKEKVDEKEKLE